jgi:hypothetical protein
MADILNRHSGESRNPFVRGLGGRRMDPGFRRDDGLPLIHRDLHSEPRRLSFAGNRSIMLGAAADTGDAAA